MRCLLISDVHANLAALESVVQDAGQFDFIWCLGDMVGYGPNPNECIALLRQFPHLCLAGNHDWAALGKLDVRGFNADARAANQWTLNVLTPESQAYLQGLLPQRLELGYTLVHGSPRQPIWEYVLDPLTAELNFPSFKTAACFVGHTHVPVCFFLPESGDDHLCEPRSPRYGQAIILSNGRWIVNPGSVGQPRDGLPYAAYAVLDVEHNTLEHRRVEYPVQVTQERMRAVKLPQRLIDRLAVGH